MSSQMFETTSIATAYNITSETCHHLGNCGNTHVILAWVMGVLSVLFIGVVIFILIRKYKGKDLKCMTKRRQEEDTQVLSDCYDGPVYYVDLPQLAAVNPVNDVPTAVNPVNDVLVEINVNLMTYQPGPGHMNLLDDIIV